MSKNISSNPPVQAGKPAESADTPLTSAVGLPLPKNWLAIISFIWAGQAVSMITSYAAGYAVVWYVTESTGSALVLAVMNICVMLPIGLLSPFGGIVADKHTRKMIRIVADGAIGLISVIAGFIILAGDVSLVLLILVCVARAVGQAFHSPAMMATMPMLVPDKHLLRINTLDQLLASIAGIGAPAFGIFLYTTRGFSSVMFLDFIGALFAIAGLALAKVPTVIDETATQQHVIANLRDGFRAVAASRGLLLLIVMVTIGMMIFGPLSAVFPLMTYEHFSGDGYMASLVEAAFGIGMLVGSGILMAWGGGKRLAGLIAVAAVIVGATTAACGLLPPTGFVAFVVLVVERDDGLRMVQRSHDDPHATQRARREDGARHGPAQRRHGARDTHRHRHRRRGGRAHGRSSVFRGGRHRVPRAGPRGLHPQVDPRPRRRLAYRM